MLGAGCALRENEKFYSLVSGKRRKQMNSEVKSDSGNSCSSIKMNPEVKRGWENYCASVEKLDEQRAEIKKGNKKLESAFKNAKKMGTSLFGKDAPPNDLVDGLADALFTVEEELLKIKGNEVQNGNKYGNLIDTDQYIKFIAAEDAIRIDRYARDHYNTLVLQRNGLLSKSMNISPFIGMAGLMLQGAALSIASLAVLGLAMYMLFL